MRKFRKRLACARRASAAVEFAIACLTVLLLFCGLADYGLALWDKSMLANAASQGSYYAFLTGTNVSGATVQTMVQKASKLSGVRATVTGPACYCISGSPPALSAATCGNTCADGTTAGYFLKIVATYPYPSILAAYSKLNNTTLTEQTTVRLQ